jgi:type III pantothenate kinase
LVVNDKLNTGIKVCIDNPGEVGADRIVNAVAAYFEFKTALVIIDFGTAITWDCVSAKGEYLGGIIAPGLSISMEALGSRTAKLPQVDISTPPTTAIGTNTVAAIKSGILFGYGAMVDGLVQRVKKELEPDIPHTIATGGMARMIAPYAESIDHVDPMLTLKGLRILHERNK